ncbi:MAG: hypothetical protein ACKKL6_01545 [Candidatus Komeilibacteria bacterium]
MIKKLITALVLPLLLITGSLFGNNKASPAESAASFVKQDIVVAETSNAEKISQEVSAIPAVQIVSSLSSFENVTSLYPGNNTMMIPLLAYSGNGGECAISAIEISYIASSYVQTVSTREYANKNRATFT